MTDSGHEDGATDRDGPSPARAMFAADAAAAMLGIELVDVTPGCATVRMTVRDDMLNGFGTTHGGVLFLLADSAFSLACNSHGPLTVAAAASIDFLAPAHEGDVLIAKAVEQSRRDRTGLYDVAVTRHEADGVSVDTVAHFRGRSRTLV